MWERFEKYLNDGEYEKAEQERIDKLNAALTIEGEEISLTGLFEIIDIDKCDKIEFALFNRQAKYEIDKEKFFKLADEIYLKDVKNTYFAENIENNFFIIKHSNVPYGSLVPISAIVPGSCAMSPMMAVGACPSMIGSSSQQIFLSHTVLQPSMDEGCMSLR